MAYVQIAVQLCASVFQTFYLRLSDASYAKLLWPYSSVDFFYWVAALAKVFHGYRWPLRLIHRSVSYLCSWSGRGSRGRRRKRRWSASGADGLNVLVRGDVPHQLEMVALEASEVALVVIDSFFGGLFAV